MIDRRRPIQSVLANRKMFANGGAVSTEPSFVPYVTRANYEGRIGGPSSREEGWFLPGATSAMGGSASNESPHVPYVHREDYERRIGGPSPHPDEWFLQPGQPVPQHPDRSGPTAPRPGDYPPLPEPRFPVVMDPNHTLRLTAERARQLTSPVRNNPNAVTDAMGNVIDLGQGLIPIAEPGFLTGNWRKDARTQFGFLEDPHQWRNPETGEEVTMPDSSWIPPSQGWEFRNPLVPDSPWQKSPYDPAAPWVAEQAALPVAERFGLPSDFPTQDAAGIMRARAANITDPGLNYPTEYVPFTGRFYAAGPYKGMPVRLAREKSAAIGDYAHEGGPSTWEAYTPPATDPGLDYQIERGPSRSWYMHGPYAGLNVDLARRRSREAGPENWMARPVRMAQGGAVGFANGGVIDLSIQEQMDLHPDLRGPTWVNPELRGWGGQEVYRGGEFQGLTPHQARQRAVAQYATSSPTPTGIATVTPEVASTPIPVVASTPTPTPVVAPPPTGMDFSLQEQMNLHPHLSLPTWVEPELRGWGGQEVYREGEFKGLTPHQARQRAVAQYAAGRLPAPGAGIGAFSPMGAVQAGGGDEGQGMYSYPGDTGQPGYYDALDKAFDTFSGKDLNSLTMDDLAQAHEAGRETSPSNHPSLPGIVEAATGRHAAALGTKGALPSLMSLVADRVGILDVPTRAQLEKAVGYVTDRGPTGVGGPYGLGPGPGPAWGTLGDITGGMEGSFSGMGSGALGSYSSSFGNVGSFGSPADVSPTGSGAAEGMGTDGYYASGGAVTNTARPQGIMASSQPLMEAVVSDALNPMGGETLTNLDGTLSMAQGGAVGFQQGGANYAPLYGSRTQIGLGAAPQDMIARSKMGRGELAQKMFPYEASTGPLTFLNRPGPAGLGQPPGPSRPIVSALRVPTDFLDQSIRSLSQINASLGRILVDTAEFIGSKRDWSGINTVEDVTNAYGQIEAVNAALRRAPEVEGVSSEEVGNAISRIAKDTVSQDPNITGKKLSGIIAENIRDMFESGYLMAREDVELDPNEPDFAALADEDMPFGPRSDDMAGMEFMPGGGDIQPAEAPAVVDQEPPAEAPAVVDQKSAALSGLSDNPEVRARQEKADADRTAFLEGDPGFDEAELRGAEAVAKTFDKKEMPADEATKTLEDYVARFKEVMPEYEGATEQERGWMILEAGLRVMAGQSPDAITNIAKGLQGLGPQLAKDAKEKRAWNRQVDLSAAKYGLENVARDAAELRADAKSARSLYTEVFRVRKGQTFERNGKVLPAGSTVILRVGEIQDGTVDLDKLVTEDSLAAGLKAYNTRLKLQLDQIQKTVTDPSKFEGPKTKYMKNAARVRTNIAVQAYLSNALAALSSGDVVGIKGSAKDWILKLANATGSKEFAESALGKLTTKAEYVDFTERATTKFIEGLISEGGKISDFERNLARELSGAIGTRAFSGIASDTSILERKLRSFKASLTSDSDIRLKDMGLTERVWDTRFNTTAAGRVSYGQMLRDTRAPLSSGRRSSQMIPGSVNWKNIIKIDPKTNTVMGLKPRKDWK